MKLSEDTCKPIFEELSNKIKRIKMFEEKLLDGTYECLTQIKNMAGAMLSESRILESENEELKQDMSRARSLVSDITDTRNKSLSGKIMTKLERMRKENEELLKELTIKNVTIHEMNKLLKNQRQQIEKMKCCANCKCFSIIEDDCVSEKCKWELKQ